MLTLVKINQYNAYKQNSERKIGHADAGLMATTVLNTKNGEVENKKPDIGGFVKKTDYDAKIWDIKAKDFTVSDYKFTSEILDTILKHVNLPTNSDINPALQHAKKNKEKTEKLQTFDLRYFLGEYFLVMMVFKICLFINQHLMFELKEDKDIEYVVGWKSKWVSASKLTSLYTVLLNNIKLFGYKIRI